MLVEGMIRDREVREAAERIETNLLHSGLPPDYRSGVRRTGDLPGSVHGVLSMCQGLGAGLRGLFLHGKAGSFKTSLGAAFLASQIRGGARGLYVSAQDLMTNLHASYGRPNGETRADIVDRYAWTPCLVLDDLGKEKASEHAAGVIFEILDGRYRNAGRGHWMIVTSNYDLDGLCDRFPGEEAADPIRRRLAELTVSVQMGAK